MSASLTPTTKPGPKRKKIFFAHGFQLRYALWVAGSLVVLLGGSGFHAIFVAKAHLTPEVFARFEPLLVASTWRLFVVGILYIAVVTFAAILVSHRAVGSLGRLEEEIHKQLESHESGTPLKIREGDELEDLVGAINLLIKKIQNGKKS